MQLEKEVDSNKQEVDQNPTQFGANTAEEIEDQSKRLDSSLAPLNVKSGRPVGLRNRNPII